MIPDGWKSITIGDLTSSHSYGPRFNAKNYDENGNVKTIRNTDVTAEGEILYAQAPIASLEPEIIEQHALKTGDLIVITTADCGLSAIFKEQDIPYIPSAYAVRYRLNQNVLPLFIKYFMHTKLAQKQVAQFIRKGTVANLPGSDVLKIKLVLPPLSEQKKIAEILGSVEESIASTQAVIDQTRKVKQGLLQQLLTKGIGHTKFKESAIGKIPESWEVDELSKVARVIDCKHRTPEYTESGFPVVRPRDIKEGSLDLSECLRTTKEDYEDLIENHRPSVDDVIYSRNATFGVAAIVETTEPFTVGQDVCIIVGERLKGRTLFYLLNSCVIRCQLDKLSAGSTFKRINLKDIRQFKVPIIPDYEQAKIVAIADSITAELNTKEHQVKQLHTLKEGLMQDLLTGKVRVKQTSPT